MGGVVKDFNINKNLFARLNVFPSVRGAGCGEINLEVCVFKNDMRALEHFNHLMIREANSLIYCGSEKFIGLEGCMKG